MEKIIIEKLRHGFNVIQGDKNSERLSYEEVLGLISALIMPEDRPCICWMKSKEEHEAFLNRGNDCESDSNEIKP